MGFMRGLLQVAFIARVVDCRPRPISANWAHGEKIMLARVSFFVALALATPTMAEEIACEGAFAIDSSAARLIEVYGAGNVVTGTVPGPEGTEMLATTVFPGDDKKSLQFVWWDEENLTDPAYIELSSAMTAPGGVRIGMTLGEIEAL